VRGSVAGLVDDLNATAVTAPAAGDRIDGASHDLRVFDRELAPDREVVEGLHRRGLHHVETSQVAAGGAAVARSHALTVSVSGPR